MSKLINKMSKLTKDRLKAALIRAVRTIAQTFVAMIGGGVVFSDINWGYAMSASLFAGVLSIAMSIAGLPEVDCGKENT